MISKSVQFNVNVKNLDITSGDYKVFGIGNDRTELSVSSFQGNTFSVNVDGSEGDYFAVVVLLKSYNNVDILDKNINLLATFRLTENSNIVMVCPESSIASIYTFAQMTTVRNDGFVDIKGEKHKMKIAYGMKQNFYVTEGQIGALISNSPNALETNSFSMFNSLCNLLYYCIIDTSFYTQFLNYAWHETSSPNNSFLGAVRNIIFDPFHNAVEIYQMLVDKSEVYSPSLTTMKVPPANRAPNNWTLTIKNNTSGSLNFIPSGLGYVVFDADDNAWIGNNFRAGGGYSATHGLVYKYDATPASFSPVQGGGLLGAGFGTAVDHNRDYVTFGNFGWSSEFNNPQEGSISRFSIKDGRPLNSSNGITTQGLNRVQGMDYDSNGNLWLSSIGCQDPFAPAPKGDYQFSSSPSAIVVYLDDDPENMLICNTFPIKKRSTGEIETIQSEYLKIFDVCLDPTTPETAFISCIGTYHKESDKSALSTVYKVAINRNMNSIDVLDYWFSDFFNEKTNEVGFESLRQVTCNANGDVIVVGVESSRATVLHNDLSQGVIEYYDTATYSPWGVKVDMNGTVFLANFAEETGKPDDNSLDMEGPFGVTMLRDTSDSASAKLLTVPTGGSEVTLANGFSLYGSLGAKDTSDLNPNKMKCFQPLMRLTATNIDRAGNLWCLNNWKPSAKVDVQDNPGGDGPVIFIGIAAPEEFR